MISHIPSCSRGGEEPSLGCGSGDWDGAWEVERKSELGHEERARERCSRLEAYFLYVPVCLCQGICLMHLSSFSDVPKAWPLNKNRKRALHAS